MSQLYRRITEACYATMPLLRAPTINIKIILPGYGDIFSKGKKGSGKQSLAEGTIMGFRAIKFQQEVVF